MDDDGDYFEEEFAADDGELYVSFAQSKILLVALLISSIELW